MELYEVNRLYIHCEIDLDENVKFNEPDMVMSQTPNPDAHAIAFLTTQIAVENFDHSLEPPL